MTTQQERHINMTNTTLSIQIPHCPYFAEPKASEISYEIVDEQGYTYSGDTIDEAMVSWARGFYNFGSANMRDIDIKLVLRLSPHESNIVQHMQELIQQRRASFAATAHATEMATWEKELDALREQSDYYTEKGYAVRLAEIMARKPEASQSHP